MNHYFIIENEQQAIDCINYVFKDYTEFSNLGDFNSENDAMNTILKNEPRLVFLNIDTALNNPFHFVNELSLYTNTPPFFIAISSQKEKAYKVLKSDFFDFLLKPLTELEVRKTLLKFQKKYPIKEKKHLCIKSYKDYQYLNTEEILFLKADNNTTDFYFKDGKIISAFKTLKSFESRLPGNFLRIHKSYIVNQHYISRVNYGKSKCTLKNSNHFIPFTKTYAHNIDFILKTLSGISISDLN